MKVFAIDPGNVNSAYAVMETRSGQDYALLEFGKYPNKECMKRMVDWIDREYHPDRVIVERVASYGMAVGREVFETCEWIGRFSQEAEKYVPVDYIYRKDEKVTICGNMKAKDSNIRQALIDRFAQRDLKNGRGTKKDPDYFYGVAHDVWAAISVAVTYLDMQQEILNRAPQLQVRVTGHGGSTPQ